MAVVAFSKFAEVLRAALKQHHLLGFEIAQLLNAVRSLMGYCPWGHKESDMTDQLTLSIAIL